MLKYSYKYNSNQVLTLLFTLLIILTLKTNLNVENFHTNTTIVHFEEDEYQEDKRRLIDEGQIKVTYETKASFQSTTSTKYTFFFLLRMK